MSALLIICVYKILIILLTFGCIGEISRVKINLIRILVWGIGSRCDLRHNICSLSSPVYFNKVLLVFKTSILAR